MGHLDISDPEPGIKDRNELITVGCAWGHGTRHTARVPGHASGSQETEHSAERPALWKEMASALVFNTGYVGPLGNHKKVRPPSAKNNELFHVFPL